MKRAAVTTLAGIAVFAAHAADYTWSGGSSGAWNTPSNWSTNDGTVPGAGDTATFDSETTITDGITIDGGTLTIVRNATVTIQGAIADGSSAGALAATGACALHLYGDNTFSGGFTASGTCSTSSNADGTGSVYAHTGTALGSGVATIDTTTGPYVYIDGGLTITNEIVLTSSAKNNTGTVYANTAGSITFDAPFTTSSKFYFYGKANTDYYFNKKLKIGQYFFGSGIWHLRKASQLGTPNTDAVMHFYETGNTMASVRMGTTSICHATNALPASSSYIEFRSKNSKLDINGFPQLFTKITHANNNTQYRTYPILQPKTTFVHELTSTDPAIVTMAFQDHEFKTPWWGCISGRAGLCWNPEYSASEFVFSNTVQTTTGELHVSNGVVRVLSGAALPYLTNIVISATGSLVLDDSAGVVASHMLDIATGSVLDIPAGHRLLIRDAATKDGDEIPSGTYDASSGYFTGGGILQVSPAGNNEWQGGTDTSWSTADNWSLGRIPAAGDSVFIGSSSTVTLDSATPALKVLIVESGSTLKITGWNSAITAETVAVNGTLTSTGAFSTANDDPSNRVWIVCSNMVVSAGGAIDMDKMGWAACCGPGSTTTTANNSGAAHGGNGSLFNLARSDIGTYLAPAFPLPYDDPYAPVLPGSGGCRWSTGTSGGGAVLIEAAGSVTVNGSILASAGSLSGITAASPSGALCGSGGSIWIKCASISGDGGVIRADGGDGDLGCAPDFISSILWGTSSARPSSTGGGGMIRIEYGSGQSSAVLTNMVVSAANGIHRGYNNGKAALTVANCDLWRTEADLGTLTFTDTTIVDQLLGKGLSGRLVGISSYTYSGDLEWTDGNVRFAGEGADVRFIGDLTLSGDGSRLEVGGVSTRTNASFMVDRWGGTVLNKLTVDGDLTVTDGAALDIRAAETNATMTWGGEVEVGGDFTVGQGAYVYPWCDIMNLGASHFTVGGDFTVSEGGTVCADRRGGAGAYASVGAALKYFIVGDPGKGHGIGAGTYYSGGAYGGAGGVAYSENDYGCVTNGTRTAVCGNEWFPSSPGSGGGCGGYVVSGEGGGLVYVEAQGDIVVDGLVTANGFSPYGCTYGFSYKLETYCRGGAGSGGGIYLAGRSFAGTGQIAARGGDGTVNYAAGTEDLAGTTNYYASACGGGGRVSIAVGFDVSTNSFASCRRSTTPDQEDIAALYSFTGSFDVSGGTNISSKANMPQYETTYGGSGTVRFVGWLPRQGTVVILR